MKKVITFSVLCAILNGCNSLDTPPEDLEVPIQEAVLMGEELALNWLKENQNEDGTWGTEGNKDSLTALAILAFISKGETPASESYGETVKKGLIRIMNRLDDKSNRLKNPEKTITMWCLAETYGMTRIPMLENYLLNWMEGDDFDFSSPYTGWALYSCYIAGVGDNEKSYKDQFNNCLESYKKLPETILNQSVHAYVSLRLLNRKEPVYTKLQSISMKEWKNSGNPVLTALSLWLFAWGIDKEKEWHKDFWPDIWASQIRKDESGYWSKESLGISNKLSIPDMSENEKRIYITSMLIISIPPFRRLPTFRIQKEPEKRKEDIELIID